MSDDQKTNVKQRPVEDPDWKERIKGFENELNPLLGKYEIGLTAIPQIAQDGRLVARVAFFSDRKKAESEKTTDQPATASAVIES